MIKHIVLFQFKNDGIKASVEFAKKSLQELKLLDSIKEMEIGEDIEHSAYSNFHLSVTCLFSSMQNLDSYQQHPLHKAFATWLKTTLQQRACVDYNIK